MEGCVGVGRAVRRDEQLRAVEERRLRRHQADLARPLRQRGRLDRRAGCGVRCRLRGRAVELAHRLAGAAAGRRRTAVGVQFHPARLHPLLHSGALRGLDGLLVVGGGLALRDRDRTRGAFRQAVAHAVAVVVAQERGLSVHHADGAFVAGLGAEAAAVAFLAVDLDDFPGHGRVLSFRVSWNGAGF